MRKKSPQFGQLALPLVQPNGFAGVREAIRQVKKECTVKDEALAERMVRVARLSGLDLKITGSTLAKITSEPQRISIQMLEAFVKATGDVTPLAALCEACGAHLITDEQWKKLLWAEAYWDEKELSESRKTLERQIGVRR
jgi:ribosomal protein L10